MNPACEVPFSGKVPFRGRYWIDKVDIATGRRVRLKELSLADQAGAGIMALKMSLGGEAYAYSTGSSLFSLYLAEGLR